MVALSSPFFGKHPKLLTNSSNRRINVNKPALNHHFPVISSSKYSFEPIKKLIKHTSKKLQVLKNHSPLQAADPEEQYHAITRNRSNIFFNTLDDFICNFLDLPLAPSVNPKQVFSTNYAPVDELPPTACDVTEGSLPSCLHGGAYIRNGPNPQFINPEAPYHMFDGDGMLHVIKISDSGEPTYCSRYVKTYKYRIENKIGDPVFPSIFSSFNNGLAASVARFLLSVARVIAGQFDPVTNGLGAANTSVALFGGRLFALCESDLPYAVKVTADGDIETLGRHDFRNEDSPFMSMTAHPKIDRETGEMFAYGCNIERPFLTFFILNSDGEKRRRDVPMHSIEGITAVHDFAVTKNYAIFPDTQIVVRPVLFFRGSSPVGADSAKVPRLGIIPRYGEDESEMWWIDVPGLNILHCFNSWEELDGDTDTIVIVVSNIVAVDQILENIHLSRLTLEKVTIDVKGKSVVHRQPLSTKFLDYGVINPVYAAKKNRYVYAGVIGPNEIIGIVKLDLSLASEAGRDCTVASRLYGSGWCGGEPFFVARDPNNNPEAEEDDGYLVTYVHDENSNESKLLVMDAKSPNLDIVAAVKLPRRVPNGFHGLFVPQSELHKLS